MRTKRGFKERHPGRVHNAGIRTVAVLSGGAFHTQDLEEAGAVAVYEDCAALLETDFPE